MIRDNLTGQKFGKLTVMSAYGKSANRHTTYLCKCECGNYKVVASDMLKSGRVSSCGCAIGTHHLTNTRLYNIWSCMKSRCLNSKHPRFKDYGGRGIKVCDEWQNDFLSFYNWAMSNGYSDILTIDRINNDDGYYPENCRWATYAEQNLNRRVTRK